MPEGRGPAASGVFGDSQTGLKIGEEGGKPAATAALLLASAGLSKASASQTSSVPVVACARAKRGPLDGWPLSDRRAIS